MNNELLKKIKEDFQKTVRFNLEDQGSLIGLPNKYTVPNVKEGFQEMYYWDTYFANMGLISLGEIQLAKGNTDNLLYLVEKFGYVPNGSRYYFLSRSQPPFLSKMVKDIYAVIKDKIWLKNAYQTLKKEYDFWQKERVLDNGLNAYNPPINSIEQAKDGAEYLLGRVQREPLGEENFVPKYPSMEQMSEEQIMQLGMANLSFCECGWDYSSRFLDEGQNVTAICLNSLLYGVEKHMQYFSDELGLDEDNVWENRAEERRCKMQSLWSEKENLFLDYNLKNQKFCEYKSLASVYPMYANLATEEQARKTVEFILNVEVEYGFACGENKTIWRMQWDYPKVWAPLQVILYESLNNYGYTELANKVAKKYMSLVEKQYKETGETWEKYDGVTGGHPDSAKAMVGWTAGAYAYFYSKITQ